MRCATVHGRTRVFEPASTVDARRRASGFGASRIRWLALLSAWVSLYLNAANAATIVTNHVISETRHVQTGVPVTFGQIFKAGDVAKGESLTATLQGRPVPLQVDVKAANPDGSLRHAVLTVLIPALAGGANDALTISTASRPAAREPVTLARLLASHYDATASLDINGTHYTIGARALLMAANSAGTCKQWGATCNLWLSGPLVGAWVVNGSLTSASGATNPDLRVYFAVRAYAGTTPGSIGFVRTDIIVENTRAFSPQAQPQYTATLTSGSASYTSPVLTQYAYTRWHKVLWWNNVQPVVYLQQDTRYIQNSMAVSRYMALKPDEPFLAGLRQSCAPMDHCDQTQAMGTTGAQAAIGPLPRWTSVYIVDPDVRAYNWMLANTDALGAYSIHYRDQATGWPVSIAKHPYVTIANWRDAHRNAAGAGSDARLYRRDLLPNCVRDSVLTQRCTDEWYGTGNPNAWDNAHQPAESYVPYMVTGDYYYMEELAFAASHNEVWSNESYRGYSKGLIDASHSQVRAKAWVLREMANAAYLLPDGYPLKAEFNADVNNALADFNKRYTDNPNASPLGVLDGGAVYPVNGHPNVGMAPWQHNFLTWSAGHAAELGFPGAAAFRNWLAKFEIGLMTDWQNNPTRGYCWLEASAYSIQVKDVTGSWLPSFSAVYAMTFPSLVGQACDSRSMVEAIARRDKRPRKRGEMGGYPASPTGFPANFQIGLAAAADSTLPGAVKAWRIFESRSIKPVPPKGYNNYPNFAIVPRSIPGS